MVRQLLIQMLYFLTFSIFPYNDLSETLFFDWRGDKKGGSRGDIYIAAKGKDCAARVGRIPLAIHSNLLPGESNNEFSMEAVMQNPPNQGNVTCDDPEYQLWTGGDMSRDGKFIALRRSNAVFFYPRLRKSMSVVDALSEGSCPFVAATTTGLPDEDQFEAIGLIGGSRQAFAETSECNNKSDCHVPVYFYNLEYSMRSPATFCWNMITYDNFESRSGNNFDASGSEVDRSDDSSKSKCGGNCACTGDWAMKIADDSGIESLIYHKSGHICSLFSHLRVNFQFMWSRSEQLDAFFLELSLDNGNEYTFVHSWALQSDVLGQFIDNEKCYEDAVIIDAIDFGLEYFTDKMKLRFRSSANGSNDSIFIDEVKFEGANSNSCDERSRLKNKEN